MEAGSVAAELRHAGYTVQTKLFQNRSISNLGPGPLLLRLSDPVMHIATHALTRSARSFLGPSAPVLERCYDKYEAYRVATANGVDCPITVLACDAATISFPLVLKPRRGSDSIGVRVLRQGPIPEIARSEDFIAQQHIRGTELTIGVLRDRVGMPLRIHLPEGAPYTFLRKYLWRPRRAPLGDLALAARVQRSALDIARILGVDWAARIDLIHEEATNRLRFLECDVASLIGARSAFAASLEAAGFGRAEQLRLLLNRITKER
jgi:D-alanine-D-alanine ligase-like ATP-grasp enzyme